MSDDERSAAQLQRMQQAFGVDDYHALAIRLGVEFSQMQRWLDGAPIPWAVFTRAAERCKASAAWLACRPEAAAPLPENRAA